MYRAYILARSGGSRARAKAQLQKDYWTSMGSQGALGNAYFERFFTANFDLDRSAFTGKRILDVGCGPAGTLEWATDAMARVGLDPLAATFAPLGVASHAMRYVAAAAERTPFPDAAFDVVSAFNALDHVDDLGSTIAEFKRLTKPGGTFLLIADVNRETTLLQPSLIRWDVLERFRPEFDVVSDRRYEHTGEGLYQSITDGKTWSAGSTGRGVLSARLVRV